MSEVGVYRIEYEFRDGVHCLVLDNKERTPVAEIFPMNWHGLNTLAERLAFSYNICLDATLPTIREYNETKTELVTQFNLAILGLAQWDAVYDGVCEAVGYKGNRHETIAQRATFVLEQITTKLLNQ